MRLTLRQLQLFVAIAHTGSTTAAAERVALSQSAVSAAINELERSLNTPLFDRVGKRLLLNDSGRAILPQALAVLDGAESLERSCLESSPSLLRIGASLTIGNYLLPRLLADYWHAQGITLGDVTPPLQISVASTADIMQRVGDFEVDIGLVEGICHRADIDVTPWREDELLIVASPQHPIMQEYGDDIVPSTRLSQANWLLREPGSGTREALEQTLLPQLKQLRSSLEFSDHEAIKHAAAEGLGIACLSKLAVADMLESGRLVVLNNALGNLKRHFYLLLQQRKQVTPGMRRLIDFLQAR
jgi:DNA-binding transcriptional LysR family regulator